jgi:hypothetical protein
MPYGELVTAGYVSVVYVCRFCIKCSGRLEYNFRMFPFQGNNAYVNTLQYFVIC